MWKTRSDLYELALLQAGSYGSCLGFGMVEALQQLLVVQQAALHNAHKHHPFGFKPTVQSSFQSSERFFDAPKLLTVFVALDSFTCLFYAYPLQG